MFCEAEVEVHVEKIQGSKNAKKLPQHKPPIHNPLQHWRTSDWVCSILVRRKSVTKNLYMLGNFAMKSDARA